MNSRTLLRDLTTRLTLDEPESEKEQLAMLALQHVFGWSATEIQVGKNIDAGNREEAEALSGIIDRLNQHEPIQYITGKAAFYGREFLVTPAVLIPRPETEELVSRVLEIISAHAKGPDLRVLDIGTGSGCIAVTLALELRDAHVKGTDIDAVALNVAKQNAAAHRASVEFMQHDIRNEELPVNQDVVVSNPPYIGRDEQGTLRNNVVKFEPHVALFVDDRDPLAFYRAIARRSKKVLSPAGLLAVEINERYGREVAGIFLDEGFSDVTIEKDISKKDRIVTGFLR